MKEIQLKELMRSIRFIEGVGCKFKIIAPDGLEYGDLEVKPIKGGKRAAHKHPRGEVRGFYAPQINLGAPVGSVQVVQIGDYEAEDIRSGLCSYLSTTWGKKTYTTCHGKDGKSIEVLRISDEAQNEKA